MKSKAEIAWWHARMDAVRAEIARADTMTDDEIAAEALAARQQLGNLTGPDIQPDLFDRKRERNALFSV